MVAAHTDAQLRALRTDSTSQGLLLTLLGDHWFGRTVHIPSAALVALLGEFGISPQAARSALSRVQRAGYLEGRRDGRRTAYRLTEEAAERATLLGRRIMRFTAEQRARAPTWNGRWTIVAYALQADQADERRRIRQALRSLGFGPLQDAVWVCPWPRAGHAERAIADEPTLSLAVFEDAGLAAGTEIEPLRIWGLDTVEQRYRDVIGYLDGVVPAVSGRARPAPEAALVMRTEAMERWRSIPAIDPRLPVELLPSGWPGWEARQMFAKAYDRLGPAAAERVRDVVAPYSEEAAAAVRHDSVAEPR